jgi:hypothetical protein
MRFMIIVKATKESEAGVMPGQELLGAMMKYNEELVNAGVMQAGEGLHASAKGARITFMNGKPTVTDGPFAETKELVAGFWIWKCKSMEEAIAWAKRCPSSEPGPGTLEIRQIIESEEFAPVATPELIAKENELRARVEQQTRK